MRRSVACARALEPSPIPHCRGRLNSEACMCGPERMLTRTLPGAHRSVAYAWAKAARCTGDQLYALRGMHVRARTDAARENPSPTAQETCTREPASHVC